PKEAAENKVVEEGIRALREFLSLVKSGKERLDKEFATSSEKVLEKLNVATQNDMDVIKEMARIAREKVDKLEKRVAELESRLGKAE
ncbi:MAG: accessory factor UbiK family protein, partial [Deltaproteobacteria bacterium]|nr:accessory factor UbiK family protein [Deltaproteobacteria bacterium]